MKRNPRSPKKQQTIHRSNLICHQQKEIVCKLKNKKLKEIDLKLKLTSLECYLRLKALSLSLY